MKSLSYALETCLLALAVPFLRLLRLMGWRSPRVTIIGWWGSETLGDIAILGQLLDEIRAVAPGSRVTLVSFDTSVTRNTLSELGASGVSLAGVGIHSALAICTSGTVIVGGGPLMESPTMLVWAWTVRLSRFTGARVLCYANGIGPIRTERVARAVTRMLRGASQVILRDDSSRTWLTSRAPGLAATVAFDPAFDFVRGRVASGQPVRHVQIALALRAPPPSYLGEQDTGAATEAFLDLIADSLNDLATTNPMQILGIVMHDGEGDSNDHAMYDGLRRRLKTPELLVVPPGRHSLGYAIQAFAGSSAALTVRFHAMIFALASGTPFVAVDYARPSGKVSGAAAMAGRESAVMRWDEVRSPDLASRLRELLHAGPLPVPAFSEAQARRLDALSSVLHPPEARREGKS